MIRKLNINGKQYIGKSNALLTSYIINKILKNDDNDKKLLEFYSSEKESTMSKEELDELLKVRISKEEAANLLSIDKKEVTAMAMELYPYVDEDELEYIVEGSIDDSILDTFQKLVLHTEEFYEKGVRKVVSVVTQVIYRDYIEVEISESFMKSYIKKISKKSPVIVPSPDSRNLKNPYSVKIYEYLLNGLSQLEDDETPKKIVITVEDLKRHLRVHGDKYELYGDFKRRILNSALDEINKLNYNVSYNEIKDGKKVVSIEFSVNN